MVLDCCLFYSHCLHLCGRLYRASARELKVCDFVRPLMMKLLTLHLLSDSVFFPASVFFGVFTDYLPPRCRSEIVIILSLF